jgi:hypothetical protein
MLTLDQRPFKKEVHALIDGIADDPPDLGDDFIPQVMRLADDYGIVINGGEFAAALFRKIRASNADAARALVNSLDDDSLTLVGFTTRAAGKVILKYGAMVLVIIFGMWAYNNCGV